MGVRGYQKSALAVPTCQGAEMGPEFSGVSAPLTPTPEQLGGSQVGGTGGGSPQGRGVTVGDLAAPRNVAHLNGHHRRGREGRKISFKCIHSTKIYLDFKRCPIETHTILRYDTKC